MSQYPYGYGQYPGVPPPPTQYAYPNAVAYPPASGYGSPHDPNAAAAPAPNYYAMTQSAYDYNSSMARGIPGLGIGATPAAGTGTPYPPPPPFAPPSAWGHHVHQAQFAAGAPPDAASHYQYSGPPQFNGPADESYPPPSHNTQAMASVSAPKLAPAPAPVPRLTNAATQSSDEMEEGELSDSQFEDLYEPVGSPVKRTGNTIEANKVPSIQNESQPTSAADTPSGGFYTNEEEEGEDGRGQPMTGVGSAGASAPTRTMPQPREPATGRERTGSYSPYLSPREMQMASPGNVHHGTQALLNGSGRLEVPGLGQNAISNGENGHSNNGSSAPAFTSVAEARKEAQKAILKLWSQGVRAEDYIKAGIDRGVVKDLFNQLHLDFSTGKSVQPNSDAAPPTQQSRPSESRSSVPATSKPPAAERKTLAPPQSATKPSEGEKKDNSEERKDRIARLLAAKVAKGPAPAAAPAAAPAPAPIAAQPQATVAPDPSPHPQVVAQATASAQPQHPAAVPAQAPATSQASVRAATNPSMTAASSATSTPSTGTKAKARTKEETERLIRQKMEALQKSRELKAKEAGSDPTPLSPVKGGGGAEAATSQPSAGGFVKLPATNASPQDPSHQDKGPIPGLFLSSAPHVTQTVNFRKRPVASDFVDYPGADSLKRPFGQKRQSSSLVIDVSDGSDDEEMDVDMDLDSPDETSLAPPRSNTAGRKGPSLAEFPPLRDLSRRNVASPAPSANTPPAGMSTKDRELLAKERAIQEMKRKIAEMEAQKKAKKGSQTPKEAVVTPPEGHGSESSSANVPRASSVSADKVDAPSAQLISEAVSANLPKQTQSAPIETPRSERGRSVSVTASRNNAAKEEKRRQLAALREAREAKKREAEEKARLEQAAWAEEEARLQAELDRDVDMEAASDDNESERMSVDEESEDEKPRDNEQKEGAEAQATASPQAFSPQAQEGLSTRAATNSAPDDHEQAKPADDGTPAARMSPELQLATEGATSTQADDVDNTRGTSSPPVKNSNNQGLPDMVEDMIEDDHMEEQGSPPMEEAAAEQAATTDANEPTADVLAGESASKDSVDHVAMPDSPEVSPEPVPATISDVIRSRDDTQEMERPLRSEPRRVAAPKPNSTFVPYESPLRYFRSFVFHPEFSKVVPGGVKSLTYTNKIDPRKQLCPDELQGAACPRGQACQFQHLQDIRVSDDQILVELGKPDEYVGEEKERFIQGLKDLLQDLRTKRTLDFDSIANGIIEFRARFLGDKSKILPLKGVTL